MTRDELEKRVAYLGTLDAGYHPALLARWLDQGDGEVQAIKDRVDAGESVLAAADSVLRSMA